MTTMRPNGGNPLAGTQVTGATSWAHANNIDPMHGSHYAGQDAVSTYGAARQNRLAAASVADRHRAALSDEKGRRMMINSMNMERWSSAGRPGVTPTGMSGR